MYFNRVTVGGSRRVSTRPSTPTIVVMWIFYLFISILNVYLLSISKVIIERYHDSSSKSFFETTCYDCDSKKMSHFQPQAKIFMRQSTKQICPTSLSTVILCLHFTATKTPISKSPKIWTHMKIHSRWRWNSYHDNVRNFDSVLESKRLPLFTSKKLGEIASSNLGPQLLGGKSRFQKSNCHDREWMLNGVYPSIDLKKFTRHPSLYLGQPRIKMQRRKNYRFFFLESQMHDLKRRSHWGSCSLLAFVECYPISKCASSMQTNLHLYLTSPSQSMTTNFRISSTCSLHENWHF